jgi:hypothetical protein
MNATRSGWRMHIAPLSLEHVIATLETFGPNRGTYCANPSTAERMLI